VTSPSSSSPPAVLGRYVLVEELDAGGMGSIYVALQRSTLSGVERPCVVKTVQPDLLEHEAMRTRFLDEAKTSLMLLHKNICTTFDVDDVKGIILLAMERIAGRNLRQVLDKAQASGGALALEPDEIVDIGDELLEGLEHAHAFVDPRTGKPLHIVHRDISPKNVMIAYSGDLKIIDFGVARGLLNETRTQAGVVVGKLRYLAPEQFVGARVDQRADLVSVGIILSELFSRKRFYGDLNVEGIEKVLRQGSPYVSPALESVPRTIRSVLETATARDPEDRFEDAAAFREALRSAWGRPKQSGRLKQMMLRLFPGAEAADRAHLQSLYRRAREEPEPLVPLPLTPGSTGLYDDATQRSPAAFAHSEGSEASEPSDPDRTAIAAFDPKDLVTGPHAPVDVDTRPFKPGDIHQNDMSGDTASQRTVLFAKPDIKNKSDLAPTDELPRPKLPSVELLSSEPPLVEPPNTGTVKNAPARAGSSTDSGPTAATTLPREDSATMPVARSRALLAPAAVPTMPNPVPAHMQAQQQGTSPLVWVFVGITVAAAVSAILILALRG
jgi:serine/threonine protein kinase